MDDLISRKALQLGLLNSTSFPSFYPFPNDRAVEKRMINFDYVMQIVKEQPTIKAEPVRHGRWERYCDDKFMGYGSDGKIKYRKVYTYECDNCSHGTAVKTNYCPNCGAKMDSEV